MILQNTPMRSAKYVTNRYGNYIDGIDGQASDPDENGLVIFSPIAQGEGRMVNRPTALTKILMKIPVKKIIYTD